MKKSTVLFSILIFLSGHIFAQSWGEMGSGSNALNANFYIWSICNDPTGNIYATGEFTDGATSLDGYEYVAKWNGVSWSKLATGFVLDAAFHSFNDLKSICSDPSGNIYVSGVSTSNGMQVAKWNGTTWSQVGTGTNGLNANSTINSICSDASGNIYAAGEFTASSGNSYVAKWNGTSWAILGLGVGGGYSSICTDGASNVYATGYFLNGSGLHVVLKWNGTSWSTLGSGFPEMLFQICADPSGNIYGAGIDGVKKWDGTTWSDIFTGECFAIASDQLGNIYTGGDFLTATTAKTCVKKWDGTTWSQIGVSSHELNGNGRIQTILTDTHGNIYAAGGLTNTSVKYYVAKFTVPNAVTDVHGNSEDLQVYPNPVYGRCTVELPDNTESGTLSVTDLLGKVILTQTITGISNKKIQVDLNNTQAGMYVVRIVTNTNSYFHTITVCK